MGAELSSRRVPMGVVLLSILGGALGSAAFQAVQAHFVVEDASAPPPLVILNLADALRAGRDAAGIRAMAERLADGGFVVLDAQAVLAAPGELYLGQGGEGRP
ncbi:hypothetical protein [Thiohalocapsa marina]|uniref:hypothetical protein n=1 Tax=Thiohalocapsa marina TaxID=424902 RepID=UPI0036DD9AEE